MRLSPVVLALFACPLSLQAQRPSVETLGWLTGCWEASNATRRVVERWDAAASGEMKGSSRTTVNGAPRESERLRLFVSRDTLVYEAIPSGQALTEFRAKTVTPQEVVFENLAHDFPQRIVYTRTGADSVIARIEGDKAGQRQPVRYPYRKVTCTPDTPTPGEIARDELAPFYKDLEAREAAASSGTNSWFATNAAPSFYTGNWLFAGTQLATAGLDAVNRSVEASKTSPAVAALRDRKYSHTVLNMNIRGDTVVVHVRISRFWKFPDAQARYGAAGEYHDRAALERRLDTWTKLGGSWKLKQSEVISSEIRIDGKVESRDGGPPAP